MVRVVAAPEAANEYAFGLLSLQAVTVEPLNVNVLASLASIQSCNPGVLLEVANCLGKKDVVRVFVLNVDHASW